MGKYIKIFLGTLLISCIIFIVFGEGAFRVPSAHILEGPLLGIGMVIVLLLSYLIAQVHYLIDLVKRK